VPHCIDLELEDIFKLQRPKQCATNAGMVMRFVRTHQQVLSQYNTVAKSTCQCPGSTRFATVHIGLCNLLENRDALVTTFVSSAVIEAVGRSRSNISEADGRTLGDLYRDAKAIALDDEFWEEVKLWTTLMSPLVKILRLGDNDAPCDSKIHFHMFECQEVRKGIDVGDPELLQDIVSIHRYRWDYMYSIIMCAGYLLDPEMWDMEQEKDEETM
jgi:hypothetical protein